MKKTGLLALAAALIFPIATSAQLKNANADVTKVAEANKSVSTIQCPFTRTTKVAAISSSTKSEGTFYFSTPDNLAMKYSDGEVFVVTADNVSVTVGGKARTLRSGNHHVEDLAATLLACVKGNLSEIEGKLASTKTQGSSLTFNITTELEFGRNKITNLELTYSKKDYTLTSLKMIEKDGSYTLYQLADKTLNKSIDAKTFEHAKAKKSSAKKSSK